MASLPPPPRDDDNAASHPPSPTHPTITIHIATSPPTLDLTLPTPLTISLTLTLHAPHPITFRTLSSRLFAKPLYARGLTFTNTRTGAHVTRRKINVTYLAAPADCVPTEEHKEQWVTLYPGQPHVLDVAVRPLGGDDVGRWPHVAGFRDGQVYRVGVHEEAGVREWIVGGWEEVVGVGVPEVRREAVRFEVVEAGTFEVRRPDDGDGRLDWPVLPRKWRAGSGGGGGVVEE